MAHIVTIAGSPSASSRTSSLLRYAEDYLGQYAHSIYPIVIQNLDPRELFYAQYDGVTIPRALTEVANADAIVIATPVYKASYSGILKVFLDLLPQKAFANKVILPIACGGTSTHMLAIDYAIKPLLSALGAEIVLQGVYLLDTQFTYNASGVQFTDNDAKQRLLTGLSRLNELVTVFSASIPSLR